MDKNQNFHLLPLSFPFYLSFLSQENLCFLKKKNHKHPKKIKANGFFFPFESSQICGIKIASVNKLPSPNHNQRGLKQSAFFLNNKFFKLEDEQAQKRENFLPPRIPQPLSLSTDSVVCHKK